MRWTIFLLLASYGAAATVNCSNSFGDVRAVQKAVNSGGTVTIIGTCNFSDSGVKINKAVAVYGGGASPTINGNGSGRGVAFTVNADHVTISGLTFNSGIGAVYLNGIYPSYFAFTRNTVENTNGNSNGAITVGGILRYSLIDSNVFYYIAPAGFADSTYASLGFGTTPSCYNRPGACDIPGGTAISIYGGVDNSNITNNKADMIAGNFLHVFWNSDAQLPNPNYILTSNVSLSYNTLTRIHRIGMEVQGAGSCPVANGVLQCDFSRLYVTNLQIKGNYFHNPFLPYAPNYAFSLVPSLADGVVLNNTGVCDWNPSDTESTCGAGIENGWHVNTVQGNVIVGDVATIFKKLFTMWGNGMAIAGNPSPPSPPGLYTIQNNYFCGVNEPYTYEGGTAAAKLIQFNYAINSTSAPCPAQGRLTTPALTLQFTDSAANGSNITFHYSVKSALSIKWVQYFLDGSETPLAVQELQDLNKDFANDTKWLYHESVSTAQMSAGPHRLKAVATDVSGAMQSDTQTFTVGGRR